MKASVVIPAYNAEGFIRRTIESVLAQTMQDLEVIVVDDGSTDRTAEVVAGIGPPVALVRGPRRGVSEARNVGLARSGGEHVAFLDHDDLWQPDKLRRQVDLLDADPAAGLVFTQATVEEGGEVKEVFPLLPDPESFLSNAYENLVHWNYIPMSAVTARRCVLQDQAGPFDPRFRLAEDWDLWLRIAARLPRGGVRFIPEPLTRYIVTAGRATERMADMRLEDIAIVRREVEAHPRLATADPARLRATLYRLHEEAGYWLLKEGRRAEARRVLRAAWGMRPTSLKPLKWLAASFL